MDPRDYSSRRLPRVGVAALATATRYAKEGAGMLTSLTETDGLVELPENLTTLQKGAEVDFLPYSELM